MSREIPENFKLCFSAEQISERIQQISLEMRAWLEAAEKRSGQPVLAVCVLRGAIFFFCDLLRALPVNVEPAFCRSRGYLIETNSAAADVQVVLDEVPVKGRAVLLIDDICDTGATMLKLQGVFDGAGATEIRSAVVIHRRVENIIYTPTWIAFSYPGKEWFAGYGMDSHDAYRNLPGIYRMG